MQEQQKTFFNYADREASITNKRTLRSFITNIFQMEGKKLERLDYIFCSDEYLLKINQDFLKHDTYTDIVSFDLSTNTKETTGEIYISIDRVKENAIQLKHHFGVELLRVLFHGALHLCGYGDKTKNEMAIMREKENFYIEMYKNLITENA